MMLICPQCKFENPTSNKFCQNCGASLTEKVCTKCRAQIPLNTQQCPSCGAICAQEVWWAIVSRFENGLEATSQLSEYAPPSSPEPLSVDVPLQRQQLHQEQEHTSADNEDSYIELASQDSSVSPVNGEELQIESGVRSNESGVRSQESEVEIQELKEDSISSPSLKRTYPRFYLEVGSYLDSQQRYQILGHGSVQETDTTVGVKVLDCQPYRNSILKEMLANQQHEQIPLLAQTYIALQSYCHLGIPKIHDAWQQGDMDLVLIEDRSHWQYLTDVWRDDSTSLVQIIHYFYQMTQLWAILSQYDRCESLLHLENLRLDEKRSFCLQELYVETRERSPAPQSSENLEENSASGVNTDDKNLSIQSLGQVWHKLFKKSGRTQFGSLIKLLGDLEKGKIETLEALQLRLHELYTELQTDSTTTANLGQINTARSTSSPTMLQLEDDDLEESPTKLDDNIPTVVLPMRLMNLEYTGLTDVGLQRDHNEDYFGLEAKIDKLESPKSRSIQARGIFIVCDGMGGHAGGEVASELAVNTIEQYFHEHWVSTELPSENIIRESVQIANKAIHDINQQDARSGVGRMGTTLVMVLIHNTRVAVAHVGDSRLYRLTRKRGLEQLTTDHEVGQREMTGGVERSIAYARPDAYQLTQALGPRDGNFVDPDVQFFEINEDALLILVSDGLSDNDLLETHSQNLLPLLSSQSSLESGAQELIDLANKYNGHDNITALLIRAKVCPDLKSQI